jgi:hypothetical protein
MGRVDGFLWILQRVENLIRQENQQTMKRAIQENE